MQRVDAYFNKVAERWNWLSFGITICLMLFAVGGMLNMAWLDRSVSMAAARTVTLWAFVVGWFLAQNEKRLWMVLVFGAVMGSMVITWYYARVGDELLRVGQEFIFFIKTAYAAWRSENTLPSTFLFMQPLYEFSKEMFTMLSRLANRLLDSPLTRRDGLARVMVWELGLWLSIVWVNWSTWQRKFVLLGPLPGLMLAGVVVASWRASSLAMMFTFGCAIILMVLLSQQIRESQWERNKVGYSEYIREHSTRAAFYLAVGLVVGSGLLASIDFEAIIERVKEYREGLTAGSGDEESRPSRQVTFDPERRTLEEEFASLSVGGFPMVNLIGSGPELAEHLVMYVEVEEMDPSSGSYQPVGVEGGTVYLRGLNYERYNSHGWFTETRQVFLYEPGQEAVWAYTINQRLLRQTVTFVNDFAGLVNAVGQVAAIDIQYTIGWRNGSTPANFEDMVGAMVPQSEFKVYSLTPAFGEDELRASSTNYPDWIQFRYLALPESVPERVYQLADEVAGSADTVYDKAVALEQYLRTYPYTLDLPEPPESQDIVDYFLFDIQQGYCDYYASAMVVMARHLGIPARLAVGYATNVYDEEAGHFLVTADQAHSWVEIYFPAYGWVTFEPTAGRSEIEREPARAQLAPDQQTYELVADKLPNPVLQALPKVIGITLGVMVLLVLLYLQLNLWWLRRKTTTELFMALFERLRWYGVELGIPQAASQTPYEFSAAFRRYLADLNLMHPMNGIFQPLDAQITWLIREYVSTAYSTSPSGPLERARALREWGGVRNRLVLALTLKRVAEFRKWIGNKNQRLTWE